MLYGMCRRWNAYIKSQIDSSKILVLFAVESRSSGKMLSTRFHNKTGEAFDLKEGNAGIYSKLATVLNDEHYDVSFDPNATYREYWVGTNSRGIIVTISSDDCADSESIDIHTGPKIEKHPRTDASKQSPSKTKSWWPWFSLRR